MTDWVVPGQPRRTSDEFLSRVFFGKFSVMFQYGELFLDVCRVKDSCVWIYSAL